MAILDSREMAIKVVVTCRTTKHKHSLKWFLREMPIPEWCRFPSDCDKGCYHMSINKTQTLFENGSWERCQFPSDGDFREMATRDNSLYRHCSKSIPSLSYYWKDFEHLSQEPFSKSVCVLFIETCDNNNLYRHLSGIRNLAITREGSRIAVDQNSSSLVNRHLSRTIFKECFCYCTKSRHLVKKTMPLYRILERSVSVQSSDTWCNVLVEKTMPPLRIIIACESSSLSRTIYKECLCFVDRHVTQPPFYRHLSWIVNRESSSLKNQESASLVNRQSSSLKVLVQSSENCVESNAIQPM